MKYLIRCAHLENGKYYSKEVEAKPLIIPGFEQVQLFVFNDGSEGYSTWNVSEVTTGLAIIRDGDCICTKKGAIARATKKLQNNGLQVVLDAIASCTPVKDLPK
jgi:hypothetical protein